MYSRVSIIGMMKTIVWLVNLVVEGRKGAYVHYCWWVKVWVA